MERKPSWVESKRTFVRAWTLICTIAALSLVLAAAVVGLPIGVVEFIFGVGFGAATGLLSGVGMWELYVKPRLAEKEK